MENIKLEAEAAIESTDKNTHEYLRSSFVKKPQILLIKNIKNPRLLK
jgi:hypothetical protein